MGSQGSRCAPTREQLLQAMQTGTPMVANPSLANDRHAYGPTSATAGHFGRTPGESPSRCRKKRNREEKIGCESQVSVSAAPRPRTTRAVYQSTASSRSLCFSTDPPKTARRLRADRRESRMRVNAQSTVPNFVPTRDQSRSQLVLNPLKYEVRPSRLLNQRQSASIAAHVNVVQPIITLGYLLSCDLAQNS